MKTAAQLRALGYTVANASQAEGCTVLEAQHCFFYFNPNCVDRPEHVFELLRKSQPTGIDNNHGIVVAGDHHSSPDARFPFVIVTAEARAALLAQHERIAKARSELQAAEAALRNVVDVHLNDVLAFA